MYPISIKLAPSVSKEVIVKDCDGTKLLGFLMPPRVTCTDYDLFVYSKVLTMIEEFLNNVQVVVAQVLVVNVTFGLKTKF